MDQHIFANGFASWQKTHFEVVEALCHIRNLEEDKLPKNYADLIDRTATEDLYQLAIELTDKFEQEKTTRTSTTSLFNLIEEFVHQELLIRGKLFNAT